MKNKKGEADMGYVGMVLVVFVAIVVGIALFQASAQSVGKSTNTNTLINYTVTSSANGTSFYITPYKSITVTSITNGTAGAVIAAGNYTVNNNVVYNGQEAVKVDVAATATVYDGEVWAINGVAQPLGYIPEAGGRGIAGLIVIFSALAVAIVALIPVLKSGVMDMIDR